MAGLGRKKYPVTKVSIRKASKEAGVYLFWSGSKINYIGKAKSLQNRLSSYLGKDIGTKTAEMLATATALSYIEVSSELEALLLEAKLIGDYKPKYNVALKDDKHPLYIRITGDRYPVVLTARKQEVVIANGFNLAENRAVYGPFPSSYAVRSVLALLRRIFPFADHLPKKQACFYAHLGLCNPCPSNIEKSTDKSHLRKKYLANITLINGVLSGRIQKVRKHLEKEMLAYAKNELFEEAKLLKGQIAQLDYLTKKTHPITGYIEDPNFLEDIREKELKELAKLLAKPLGKVKVKRIECYDVAHLAGTSTTASMVTFVDGRAEKNFYRHFRVRQTKRASDFDSMREVLARRINHLLDWGQPDLIIVDGGKAQVNAFRSEFEKLGISVIGIAKREETLVVPTAKGFIEIKLPSGPAKNLVQRIRNEAHRFARRYHHNLLKKSLFS